MSGSDSWNSVLRNIVGQPVPALCCCDRTRSTADGWQFERRNPLTVRSGRAECWSTGHVSDMDQPCKATYVRTAILHSIRSMARNQWILISASVMWSRLSDDKPDGRLRSRPTGADVAGKPAGQPARCGPKRHQHLECGCRCQVTDFTQLTHRDIQYVWRASLSIYTVIAIKGATLC